MLPSKWIDELSDEDAQALADRVFKARPLTVPDLPVASLQRKLEMTWQPDAGVLLEPGSLVKALALGNSLSPTLVSALPSSPIDGQEVYYLADATNGVVWHLRYRAGSASAYKWELVGGTPLESLVDTSQTTTSTTATDLATVGPSVTVPLAGDYLIWWGMHMLVNTADFGTCRINFAGTIDTGFELTSNQTTNAWRSLSREKRKNGLIAASVVKMQYLVSGATATGTFANRWMRVLPVRVG